MRAAAIVLAAGQSTRLGEPKLLLDLGGRPLIRCTVENVAAACSITDVVVVTGPRAVEVAAAIQGLSCRLVHNPDYAAGMSTSLRCGLAALDPEVEMAVICLGDQPLVGPSVIDGLVRALSTGAKSIAQPVYDGQKGNPVVFRRCHFEALQAVTGDAGGRAVLAAHPDAVARVTFPDPHCNLDVDTRADYERIQRAWRSAVRD